MQEKSEKFAKKLADGQKTRKKGSKFLNIIMCVHTSVFARAIMRIHARVREAIGLKCKHKLTYFAKNGIERRFL